jgi:hypothetical protein
MSLEAASGDRKVEFFSNTSLAEEDGCNSLYLLHACRYAKAALASNKVTNSAFIIYFPFAVMRLSR